MSWQRYSQGRNAQGRKPRPPAEDGDDAGGAFGVPPPDDPAADLPPPFTPLGFGEGGTYYVHDASGMFRMLRVRDLGAGGLIDVCGGHTDWLAAVAPPTRNGATFEVQKAQAEFMRRCRAAGMYNPLTPRRSCGVWPDGRGGLIVHCGGAVLSDARFELQRGRWTMVGGDWQPAGFRHRTGIMSIAPSLERPSMAVATPADGLRLEKAFRMWSYAHAGSAQLITGAVALAMLGAAPAWRVHVVFTGQLGTGKSGCADLAEAALGAGALATTDATQAGLYGIANNCAITILYDEAEGNTSAQDVLVLLRTMSGKKGARGHRGTGEGGARSFALIGSMFLQAIHPPDMSLADLSRIIEIDFRPLAPGADEAKAMAEIEWAAGASASLRARMIARWADFAEVVDLYKDRLQKLGHDSRLRQVYGHALAARWLMLHDDLPDSDSVIEDVSDALGVINEVVNERTDSDDRLCLLRMVTSTLDDWRGGVKPTIATLLEEAFGKEGQASNVLEQNGIRIDVDAAGRKWVWVAAAHDTLRGIFRDTDWKGRKYIKALAQLPEAEVRSGQKFAGVTHRLVAFPYERLADGAPPEEPKPGQGGAGPAKPDDMPDIGPPSAAPGWDRPP